MCRGRQAEQRHSRDSSRERECTQRACDPAQLHSHPNGLNASDPSIRPPATSTLSVSRSPSFPLALYLFITQALHQGRGEGRRETKGQTPVLTETYTAWLGPQYTAQQRSQRGVRENIDYSFGLSFTKLIGHIVTVSNQSQWSDSDPIQ